MLDVGDRNEPRKKESSGSGQQAACTKAERGDILVRLGNYAHFGIVLDSEE